MGKKIINVELSDSEIDKVIKELELYKQDIIRKTNLLREKIAKRIESSSESGFGKAIVDDLLKGGQRKANVSVSITNEGDVSLVIATGKDAIWAEFGAGVYHNGAAGTSPHPEGSKLGFTIGGYGKGHGNRQTWGFFEDGELHLTHGAPATMPMYNAVKTVCDEIVKIAGEVFV